MLAKIKMLKDDEKVSGEDCREGLTVVISVKLTEAQFEDHVAVEGVLVPVDEGGKLPDAPLITHVVLLLLARAQVHRLDAQAGVEEGLLCCQRSVRVAGGPGPQKRGNL